MSEMKTPANFIATATLALFGLTILFTLLTQSLPVFIIGVGGTMVVVRAMIGDV